MMAAPLLRKQIAGLGSWLRALSRRDRLEAEMDEEIGFHLEARAADLRSQGLSASAAARQARLEFGAAAAHKDRMRAALGLSWWDQSWADLRYASRVLRKSPGFTAMAILSLALAIGANTTIFSVANALLYARLGVPHPEQLRLLAMTGDDKTVVDFTWGDSWQLPDGRLRADSFTYPVYRQLKAHNGVLEDIFAFKDIGRVNVTVNGNAQPARAELVSGNFYEQMQVQPILGRALSPSDDRAPGTGAVVVISDSFWRRALNRSPLCIGKVITINMAPVTIAGVNPPGFTGAQSVQQSPDFFLPLSMMPLLHAPLGNSGPVLASARLWWVQLMARARPGVDDEQARASLDVALNAAVRGTMHVEKGQTVPHLRLEDGSKGLNYAGREYADPLHVLLAMVGGVLLIACANMANLMLARASVRRREMSVRIALGAGRSRTLRQVLTESLLLSWLGGTLGALTSYWVRAALPSLLVHGWERAQIKVPFDGRVFAFTAGITIGTGIVFGLFPAWASTHAEIGAGLKQGGRTCSRRRNAWSGKAIVAFQVALSTLLVIAASLFLQTWVKLNAIDPGFEPDHLLLFDISAPSQRYPSPKDIQLHTRLEEALRSVPGVEAMSAANVPLLAGEGMNGEFSVEGGTQPKFAPEDDARFPNIDYVGTDFLAVMKIPLLAGRAFRPQDTETSPKVAIINETLARRFFPHQNPVGKRFSAEVGKDRNWIEIIGVCGNTHYDSLRKPVPPLHFDLYRQQKAADTLTYVVRTRSKPEAIVPSLRAVVQRIDHDLPLMDIRTQEEQIDAGLQQERMFAALTSGFGLLALALACVGVYGILAYTVAQRTNEIGIRLALGAARAQVRGMVLREATWLVLAGVAAGLLIALSLGRLVQSLLYRLQPADLLSLALAALLLLAVALVAGWIPAVRASLVEPVEALRHE